MPNSKFDLGKLPTDALARLILSKVKSGKNVLLPPAIGEDGGVVKSEGNILIIVADPITGATEEAGWLAVHVNANDIAVHAANPKWFLATLLFPPETIRKDIERVMNGIIHALDEIGAVLIGGHTEITDRVNDVLISGAMIGEPMVKGRYVTSGGAREGDAIVLTKGAGIEGTYILASEFKEKLRSYLSNNIVNEALKFKELISILPEVRYSIEAVGLDNIHAMHDVTEGGLLGALYEMAYASNLGFIVYEERIPVLKPTKEICSLFKLDPLKLIGSGAVLIAVNNKVKDELINNLTKKGIKAAVIGRFTKEFNKMGYLVKRNSIKVPVTEPPIDELWLLLEKKELLK